MARPKSLYQLSIDCVAENFELYHPKKRKVPISVPPLIGDKIFTRLMHFIDHKYIGMSYYDVISQIIEAEWKVQNIEYKNFCWTLNSLYDLATTNDIVKLKINFYQGWYFFPDLLDGDHYWKEGNKTMHQIVTKLQRKEILEHLSVRNMRDCKSDDDDLKPIALSRTTFPKLQYRCSCGTQPHIFAAFLSSISQPTGASLWFLDVSDSNFAWQVELPDKNDLPNIKTLVLEHQSEKGTAENSRSLDDIILKGKKDLPSRIFSHYRIYEMRGSLTSLILHGAEINDTDMGIIFHLKNLRELDISWYEHDYNIQSDEMIYYDDDHITPLRKGRPDKLDFFTIVSNLPQLQSLDISSTIYADKLYHTAKRMDPACIRKVKLPRHWNRKPLTSLGLWNTNAVYLRDLDKIAFQVFGEQNEETLLLAMLKYRQRPYELQKMWKKMKETYKYGNHHETGGIAKAEKTVTIAVDHLAIYHGHRDLIFEVSCTLYKIIKKHYQLLSTNNKRQVIRSVCGLLNFYTRPMGKGPFENSLRILFQLRFPDDFLHDYMKVVNTLLHVIKHYTEADDLLSMTLGFLFYLVDLPNDSELKKKLCSVELIPALVTFIESQNERDLEKHKGDTDQRVIIEYLTDTWQFLINLMSKERDNIRKFIEYGGLKCCLNCYKKYSNNEFEQYYEFKQMISVVMAKIGMEQDFRKNLSDPALINVLEELLRCNGASKVIYTAGSTLAFVLSDGEMKFDAEIKDEVVKSLRSAVLSWDTDDYNTESYPTLKPFINFLKPDTNISTQLFALWTLSNVTSKSKEKPELTKYCDLLVKDGGIKAIKAVIESNFCQEVVKLARKVLENYEDFTNGSEDESEPE